VIYYKSKREIEIMRKAGLILAETRLELERHIKPGISTLELDKIAHDFIISKDAYPSFKDYEGFPGSICTSFKLAIIKSGLIILTPVTLSKSPAVTTLGP
jgi:methionyl aminopeptidase